MLVPLLGLSVPAVLILGLLHDHVLPGVARRRLEAILVFYFFLFVFLNCSRTFLLHHHLLLPSTAMVSLSSTDLPIGRMML